MFESLSDRLSGVFRSFSGRGQLTEENIQAGLREVRLALLEADVNFKVVKDFVENVRQKCLGQELIKGVSPAQQVVKIVHEELVGLLGGETAGLNLQGQEPAVIMLVGLQGSGKTTAAVKLAYLLKKHHITLANRQMFADYRLYAINHLPGIRGIVVGIRESIRGLQRIECVQTLTYVGIPDYIEATVAHCRQQERTPQLADVIATAQSLKHVVHCIGSHTGVVEKYHPQAVHGGKILPEQ